LLIVLMASVMACSSAFAQTTPAQPEAPASAVAPQEPSTPSPPAAGWKDPSAFAEPEAKPEEPVPPAPPVAIAEHHQSSPLHVAAKNARLPLAIIKHDDYRDWVSAQLFMIIAGLIVTLIVLVMAPQASTTVLAAVDAEPLRCMIVGGAGMFALSIINYINGQLFQTIIWIPFGLAIAVLAGITFIYAGLIGTVYFGGPVARKLGWRVPGFFWRSALGLCGLAILNCIPFVNLGSLLIEAFLFPVGLGALIITGFGRDPGWLTKRMHKRG
jgi:hypothetical protein